MGLDSLRRRAESEVCAGIGFPVEFAPARCAPNAAQHLQEKSPVLAGAQKSLAFPEVAATTRRLFRSRGDLNRQGFLIAADTEDAPASGEDYAASVGNKQAKEQVGGGKKGSDGGRKR